MKIQTAALLLSLTVIFSQCSLPGRVTAPVHTEPRAEEIKSRVVIKDYVAPRKINTKNVNPESVVSLAESLQGKPYKWGGTSVEQGFDCSGLVYYVFKQNKIAVPRTSVEYTNAGKEIPLTEAKRGDIILFTGSDANSGKVGHMGLITLNDHGKIQFINAIEGDAGVTVCKLSGYFIPRFVKVIRVFNTNS